MNWASLLVGVLIGVVGGVLVSYQVGFLRELGREHAARVLKKRESSRQRRQAEQATAAAAAEHQAEIRRKQERIEQLQRDRIGAQFLRRVTPTDLGLRTTVVRLDERDPERRVEVQFEPIPGRLPTPYDPPNLDPVSIDWEVLTNPDSVQAHLTATMSARSHDDADGWIMFERLNP